MKRIVIIIVILLTLTTSMFACTNNRANQIVVGLECEYPPFNWMENTKTDFNHPVANVKGSFVDGYDVQIAKIIATQLDKELVIKQVSFDGLIAAIQNNEIDLIIAGMSPKPDRREHVNFTSSYYTSTHVVVVRGDSKYSNITTLDGLAGSKGVGQRGTLYDDLVTYTADTVGGTKLPARDTIPLIVSDIVRKDVDYTIVELPVALGMVSANSDLKIILNYPEENIFDVSDEDRIVSIGINKSKTELLEFVNIVLATITNDQRSLLMADAISRSNE